MWGRKGTRRVICGRMPMLLRARRGLTTRTHRSWLQRWHTTRPTRAASMSSASDAPSSADGVTPSLACAPPGASCAAAASGPAFSCGALGEQLALASAALRRRCRSRPCALSGPADWSCRVGPLELFNTLRSYASSANALPSSTAAVLVECECAADVFSGEVKPFAVREGESRAEESGDRNALFDRSA